MKVVYINISDVKGGASIVTNRLRIYLQTNHQVDHLYLVADKNLDDKRVLLTRRNIGKIFEKITDRILNLVGLQYQFFPFSSSFILKNITEFQPDVISVHNTHGGYFQTALLRRLSKIAPIVWTLHDMWSFTGNAAHTFGNDSWKRMHNDRQLTRIHPRIGLNTGAFLLRQKVRIYGSSNLSVVVPSKWLFNLARESAVFDRTRITHIYNGVDLEVFKPQNKVYEREKLGISPAAKVIMFSAGALTGNMWKGGEHLTEVLTNINSIINYKLHLLVVGSGELASLSRLDNLVVHNVGYTSSETQMAKYLSATDLFIYPTKADTLPNILIEAMACGTPCITFDIGGCGEIIINELTGKVIKPFEIITMSQEIVKLLQNETRLAEMSTYARQHANNQFSLEKMADNYYQVFRSAMQEFSHAKRTDQI